MFLSLHLFLKYQWMAFMIQLDNNTIKQLWDEPDHWKRIRLFPPTNPWIASPFERQSACKLMFSDIAYCKATHSQSQLCQGALPTPCWKFKNQSRCNLRPSKKCRQISKGALSAWLLSYSHGLQAEIFMLFSVVWMASSFQSRSHLGFFFFWSAVK